MCCKVFNIEFRVICGLWLHEELGRIRLFWGCYAVSQGEVNDEWRYTSTHPNDVTL